MIKVQRLVQLAWVLVAGWLMDIPGNQLLGMGLFDAGYCKPALWQLPSSGLLPIKVLLPGNTGIIRALVLPLFASKVPDCDIKTPQYCHYRPR